MKKLILALLFTLTLPAYAQAAFQCVIAPGAAVVSDPVAPSMGTTASPPTYQLFDGTTQVASGNLVLSSTIPLTNVACLPVEAPYNPGPAGSWAIRAGTGPLAIGSTHVYTAIITSNTGVPLPVTPPLTITVVASVSAPALSIRN